MLNISQPKEPEERTGVPQNGASAPPLSDVYRSIPVPYLGANWLKRLLAFAGPGYMVSVGYMDPGNWATDLAGGSKFGYTLLWVILASNLMAILLQTLCARLGIATGKDLARSCRDYYKRPAAIMLWILCEIAIIACDVAEVIGSAVALKLLFGLPLVWGVLITGADVLLLLGLMRFGFRKIEAIIVVLVATIAICFGIDIFLSHPNWSGVAHGLFVPSVPNREALLIAVGILGATVMPHNLYLHSSIVQTRAFENTSEGKGNAIRMSTIDTVLSLGAAFFVNAAILVLAAAVFYTGGHVVEQLEDAHQLLTPLLGGGAATLFAVALLASGQSSTITGTLAGQIVMEGFLRIRVQPWLRRLITRGLALIPALLLVTATSGSDIDVLIYSQVVLSMQLPFAIFPLVMFTSDATRMGKFVSPLWLQIVAYIVCAAITLLNISLLWSLVAHWLLFSTAAAGGAFAIWVVYFYREDRRSLKPQQ